MNNGCARSSGSSSGAAAVSSGIMALVLQAKYDIPISFDYLPEISFHFLSLYDMLSRRRTLFQCLTVLVLGIVALLLLMIEFACSFF